MTKGYRGLTVWQRAMELVEEVYRLTECMPAHERFGLSSQMQRAAVSIPSNIAEGYGRASKGDYLKHLSYARGSLAELETQIELSVRIKYIDREAATRPWELCQEVGRMLTTLVQNLKHTENKPSA